MIPRTFVLTSLVLAALVPAAARAVPLQPKSDAEVVETLPTLGAMAREQRALRRALAQQPRDAQVALTLSRSMLARAHTSGDARLAGQALGVLRAWDDDPAPPADILMQRATVRQYLHDFNGAAADLRALLKVEPHHAQALITLATVYRVQGRYADSDAACHGLQAAGQPLYARACTAENLALRGHNDAARHELQSLLRARPDDASWAAWIHTSLGELEQRAGRPDAAIAELRAALAADPDTYTQLALADLLIDNRRWRDAEVALVGAPDTDATLLRRSIAARALHRDDADALRRKLAARYAQAALRPEAAGVHARERARFALVVEGDAPRALALARANLQAQREAIDFVVMDRAARAAGDAAARAEVQALARRIGLVDARLGAPAPGSDRS